MEKKNKKKTSKKEKNVCMDKNNGKGSPLLYAALKGTGVGLGITCIIFAACALLLTYTDISDSYIGIVSTVCTALSALASGVIMSKARGRNGLLTGAAAGIIYGAVLLAVSVIAGGGPLSLGCSTCLIVAAAGGGIGGILGVNTK